MDLTILPEEFDLLTQTYLARTGRMSARTALMIALSVGTLLSRPVAAQDVATQTIVLLRHGEKPPLGLGQLNCQGLNRALALPAVIEKQFGRPDAIFAPDPAQAVSENGQSYYVRPLATIEPTAIVFGLPVDASIGVFNLDALRQKIELPTYWNALVVVAWEGNAIARLARLLVADHGGDPRVVRDWKGNDDFDSMYVVRITRSAEQATVAFEQRHEGLDGQPTTCPVPNPPSGGGD